MDDEEMGDAGCVSGMMFWMTGCVSSTRSYQRYTIEIETDPTGVEVESDVAGHRVHGSTPTVVEGDFEYRVFEKSEHWYVPGVTGGLFLAAGIILLANSRLTSTGELRMGFLLGGIYSVMAGVALPMLSLHASLMDGTQQARRAGERRWQRVGRGVPMDQVVRALPRAELTLSRPGYQDWSVMAVPGDRLRLELALDSSAPAAVASFQRPRPDGGWGRRVRRRRGRHLWGRSHRPRRSRW